MVCADSLARPVVPLRSGPLAARIGVNAIVRQVFAVPLSPPAARSHLHDRRVVFRGYRRGDGLWDIEAELHDSKTQEFVLPGEGRWAAGEPIHGMAIRLTVDNDTVVHAIEVATTPAVPNGYDPPLHTAYRRALDGFIAPERMQRFEPVCRDNAASMVQQALGLRSRWAAKPWRRASACRSTGSPPTATRAPLTRPMTSASTATRR